MIGLLRIHMSVIHLINNFYIFYFSYTYARDGRWGSVTCPAVWVRDLFYHHRVIHQVIYSRYGGEGLNVRGFRRLRIKGGKEGGTWGRVIGGGGGTVTHYLRGGGG